MIENVINITAENAQQYLIEESNHRPVVIDFWADWCEPCKTLMPLLEKLAHEYAGQFLLAKVNADELQPLAAQLGVRSLPTVIIMQNGQPIDGFVGAQPEKDIRELLTKYLPPLWQGLIEQANALMAADNFNDALSLLHQAYKESNEQSSVGVGLTQVLIHLNRLDEASALLDKVPYLEQDEAFAQAVAQLELKREASESPELKLLQADFEADPDNMEIAYQLAVQYSQAQKAREALELLLKVMKRDLGAQEGAARKIFLDILTTLGKGDPLAVEYQRKFYTLLY